MYHSHVYDCLFLSLFIIIITIIYICNYDLLLPLLLLQLSLFIIIIIRLERGEQACLANCMDRFLDVFTMVTKNLEEKSSAGQ